ncbi:hypothetical protein D4R86_02125 [bacterium]|nr:MAG: hypothetical protein D4R86_02125 [bacterium]
MNNTLKINVIPNYRNKKLSSFLLPLQGEAGGKGVWGEFRPPNPLRKSVRILTKRHRGQYFLSRNLSVSIQIMGIKLSLMKFDSVRVGKIKSNMARSLPIIKV